PEQSVASGTEAFLPRQASRTLPFCEYAMWLLFLQPHIAHWTIRLRIACCEPACFSRWARRFLKGAGSAFLPERKAFSCGPNVVSFALAGYPSSHFARCTAPAVSSPNSPSGLPASKEPYGFFASRFWASSTSGPVTCGLDSCSTRGPGIAIRPFVAASRLSRIAAPHCCETAVGEKRPSATYFPRE